MTCQLQSRLQGRRLIASPAVPICTRRAQILHLKAVQDAASMRYRSKFVVGLQGSESIFIGQTLQRELLTLSMVPRVLVTFLSASPTPEAQANAMKIDSPFIFN